MKKAANIKLISQNSVRAVRLKSAVIISVLWVACVLSGFFLFLNNKTTGRDTDKAFLMSKNKLARPNTDTAKNESYFLVLNNKLLTVTRYTNDSKKQQLPPGNSNTTGTTQKPLLVKRPPADAKPKADNSGFSILPVPKK